MAPSLPWQDLQWQRIAAMQASARLPHALLLRGPEGVGKVRFARRLVSALLCERHAFKERPCGDCRGCRLVAADSHPDLQTLAPLEGKRQIGIDQVRSLIERIGLTPRYGGRKAVLVAPAEHMTRAAANTLLKTLEEPPGDALFVLVAHRAGALPATIRSRCQIMDFPVPDADTAKSWLAVELDSEEAAETALRLAHGAPLTARMQASGGGLEAREAILDDLERLLRGDGDAIATAERWRNMGLVEALYWLLSVVCDLVWLKNGRSAHSLTHSDRGPALQGLARGLDLMGLFRLFDHLVEARRAALGQLNFNEQLTLESIAIEWRRSGARREDQRAG
ncbi:MAG: DNA polymerase III subunit delta' [Gammaproteobacteria bacterium]|nr:DNA polymerase III subunit delta' [Gammaproteobacteria bacterium]